MEDRLRKFARIVETQSFTRAAKELHTSQPALSVAIRKLERELGATLIMRHRTTFKMTAAGELAYIHAKQLDVQTKNFKLNLQQIAKQKPHIAIGMIDSLADVLLMADDKLKDFEQQVHMTLSINNSRYLLQALDQDTLDVAYVVTPRQTLSKDLTITSLGSEPLVCITQPSQLTNILNSMHTKRTLPDFLAYDKPSHTNQLVQQHFAEQGIQLQTIFHSTSPEIILHMALAGRGSAVLPYTLVAQHIKDGKLSPIAGIIERPISAVVRTQKLLPSITKDIQRLAQELLASQTKQAAKIS